MENEEKLTEDFGTDCGESYSPAQSFVDGAKALNEVNSELDQQYKALQAEFNQQGQGNCPKSKSFKLLIAVRISSSHGWDLDLAHRFVLEVTRFYHMTLIELTYWETLLKSLRPSPIVPELILLITALQSKLELNHESKCYEHCISARIPYFSSIIENWRLVNEGLGPSLRSLNQEFEWLGKWNRGKADYEEEVSFILNSTKRSRRLEGEPKVTDRKAQFEVDEFDFPPIDTLVYTEY